MSSQTDDWDSQSEDDVPVRAPNTTTTVARTRPSCER